LSRSPDERGESKLDPQALRVPPDDECRNDRLVPTGRCAEEIDDRDLLLHRIPEPTVVGRIRVAPHEGIVDEIVAGVDLLVGLALILIPDPAASTREHGADGQEPGHLTWFEDAALGVDEGNALAADLEPGPEIGGVEDATPERSKPIHMVKSRLS
jgi:hypothetical protein